GLLRRRRARRGRDPGEGAAALRADDEVGPREGSVALGPASGALGFRRLEAPAGDPRPFAARGLRAGGRDRGPDPRGAGERPEGPDLEGGRALPRGKAKGGRGGLRRPDPYRPGEREDLARPRADPEGDGEVPGAPRALRPRRLSRRDPRGCMVRAGARPRRPEGRARRPPR